MLSSKINQISFTYFTHKTQSSASKCLPQKKYTVKHPKNTKKLWCAQDLKYEFMLNILWTKKLKKTLLLPKKNTMNGIKKTRNMMKKTIKNTSSATKKWE